MMRRLGGIAASIALGVWLPIVLVALWWQLSSGSTNPYFPPLERVLDRFGEVWLSERLETDLLPSLKNLLAGYALAVVSAVGLGSILGNHPRLLGALSPEIEFGRCLPPVALLPLIIVGIGIGDGGKVFIIAFGSFWPMLLAAIDGVRGIDPVLRDVVRANRLRRWRSLRSVYLPAASPSILAGAKVALAIAVVLVVVSEMAGARRGVGYQLLASQRTFATTDMWAAMVLLGLLGYALSVIFRLMERKVMSWHPAHRNR